MLISNTHMQTTHSAPASSDRAAARAASVFAPAHRALSIGILVSITAIACEGMGVATILPSAASELGGLDAYGWAFSAFMLASLLGAVYAGQSADRYGAARPTRLAFAAFSIGLLIAGLAPAWPVLLVGRVLQGFGGGCLSAVAYFVVARGYPEPLRPRLLALLSSAWIVPALVGPAIAGQVAEHVSWRLVFLGILPAVAAGAWLLAPAVARLGNGSGPDRAQDSGRLVAAARLAGGLAVMLWGLGQDSIPPAVIGVAVGALLALPALQSLIRNGTAGARPGLLSAVAVRGLLAFGFFGAEALIPLGLATVRSVPPSLVGLALTASALAWVAGSWMQDRAEAHAAGSHASRPGRIVAGLVCIGLGIVGVGVVVFSTLPLASALVAWGIAGLGMGLAYTGSTLVALSAAPSGQEGSASAALQTAEMVGTAVGTGVAGALVAFSVHMERGVADGAAGGLVVTTLAVVIGLVAAARLAPAARGAREPSLAAD
jgi:MFS family permease